MARWQYLSRGQRDLLIEHLDGAPVPLDVRQPLRMQLVRALVRHSYLTYAGDHGGPQPFRPIITRITDTGREALCKVLADYAEALARSNDREPRKPWGAAKAEAQAVGDPYPPFG